MIATTEVGLRAPELAFEALAPRPLSTPVRMGIQEHRALFGPMPLDLRPLVQALAATGLGGYGGAGVAAIRKWESAARDGAGGIAVANAAEGEPASAKDAAIWQTRPHLVLDGLEAAAVAIGAAESVVWVHGGDRETVHAIERAVGERGPGLVPVRVVHGPDRYVSGEHSAIVRALRGGAAVPRFRPTGARSWVGGAPVLVNNSETLARVALLARTGLAGHREAALVTVVDAGVRRVREVDAGDRYGDLRGASSPAAALVGGYGGRWHDWRELAERPLLGAQAPELGAGVVALLPEGVCGVCETARIADWMAAESARSCGPCRFGLPELADALDVLAARGRAGRAPARIETLADLVDGRGACAHPDGVARMVRSALRVFADDVTAHRAGRCLARTQASVLPLPRHGRAR